MTKEGSVKGKKKKEEQITRNSSILNSFFFSLIKKSLLSNDTLRFPLKGLNERATIVFVRRILFPSNFLRMSLDWTVSLLSRILKKEEEKKRKYEKKKKKETKRYYVQKEHKCIFEGARKLCVARCEIESR